MNDGKIQYRDSLVIFIDLLGTQDRTDFEELYNINSIFHEQFEGNQANDSVNKRYYRKIFTFSDCAYIIYRDKENNPNNKGKLIAVALNNTLPVLTKFLQERMPFRGGISYGDVYFDDDRSMFFGNAINKAYQIESSISVHPRIVVDEDVAESVLKYIAEEKYKQPDYAIYCGMGFFPKYPESLEGIVEQDIDGKYIFFSIIFSCKRTMNHLMLLVHHAKNS